MAENQQPNEKPPEEPQLATAKGSESQISTATSNTDGSKSPRKRRRSSKRKKNVEYGESLAEFDEHEWNQGEVALGAEMINLKKKQNKPTVYRAAGQQTASTGVKKRSRKSKELKQAEPPRLDKADMIGQLVANIIRTFMQGKKDEEVQLEIKLIDKGGKSIEIPISPSNPVTPTSLEPQTPKTEVKEEPKSPNIDQRGGQIIREL
ncbi:hypothetical protein M3Y96_00028700 [Aphelenchoides besseyi]|nr:hypothetical protein M3Y96_00028700 [Aphelenchoides besseyi]